jgi:hypothetical protein
MKKWTHRVTVPHPTIVTFLESKSYKNHRATFPFTCFVFLPGLQLQPQGLRQSPVWPALWPVPVQGWVWRVALRAVLLGSQRLSWLCILWLRPQGHSGWHLWPGTGCLQLCRGHGCLLLQGVCPGPSAFVFLAIVGSGCLSKQRGFKYFFWWVHTPMPFEIRVCSSDMMEDS